MQLAERNPNGPLLIAEIPDAIDIKIQTLSDSHTSGAHKQESGGLDLGRFAELVTQQKVILGREGSGKVLVLDREIPANDEVISWTVSSFVSKVAKTAPQIVDSVGTRTNAQAAQAGKPLDDMWVTPQLREPADLRVMVAEKPDETTKSELILLDGPRSVGYRQILEVQIEDLLNGFRFTHVTERL
jgi:hypothetical protein